VEEILKWLWSKYKNRPVGWIILLLLIFLGYLIFVGIISDAGFDKEIERNRNEIIVLGFCIALEIVFICLLITTISENIDLRKEANNRREYLTSITEEIAERDEANAQLQQTILNFMKEITRGRIFTVNRVQLFDEKLYLKIEKEEDLELKNDSEIRVFDMESGIVMGVFEITDVQLTEFTARDVYVSPLWRGYVRQTGNVESSIPPNTISILFLKEEFNNHE